MTTSIAIVGEAFGEQEAALGVPFVGAAGQELNAQLDECGIPRKDCLITNVFMQRPVNNDINQFFGPKVSGGVDLSLPPMRDQNAQRFLKLEYRPEIDRLRRELAEAKPNLVVALGNTACWALLGVTAISKLRGTCVGSTLVQGVKVLPTYHPAAVLRQFELRPTVIADWLKAKRQAGFPELRRMRREVWLEPTLADIKDFFWRFVFPSRETMAFDIETAIEQITCIGFAPTVDRAIVIPFFDQRRPKFCYWQDKQDEVKALKWTGAYLRSEAPKVTQNGLYDVQWLWQKYGLAPRNWWEDTMLCHHSMYPESEKGLGYLGSIYCDEPAWKAERPRGEQTIKRED